MTKVTITCGGEVFSAVLEEELAPKTCAIFKSMLPIQNQMIHVRWSGEGMWIPMGDTRWEGLTYENHTSFPSKGEMLLYPGGIVPGRPQPLQHRRLRLPVLQGGGKDFPQILCYLPPLASGQGQRPLHRFYILFPHVSASCSDTSLMKPSTQRA